MERSRLKEPSARGRSGPQAIELATISHVTLIAVFCALPKALLQEWIWLGYLLQGVIGLYAIFASSDKRASNFFSPSVMSFVYYFLGFSLGSFCLLHGIVLENATLSAGLPAYTKSLSQIVFFTMACQLVLFLAAIGAVKERMQWYASHNPTTSGRRRLPQSQLLFLLAAVIFATFSILPVNLSFAGGAGSFSYPIRLAAAIALFTLGSRFSLHNRVTLLVIIMALSAIQGYHSKREIMFILILALTIEAVSKDWRINLSIKQVAGGIVLLMVLILLVLWSSIMRGYGNYKYKSPLDAFRYIPTYVSEPYFLGAASNNFELAACFTNTAQCIYFAHEGTIPLQLGSTFIKVLFAPIPRSMFKHKPESMIHIYTAKAAPAFRRAGGSIPVGLYGEIFANFHLLGLPLVYVVFRFIDRLYMKFLCMFAKQQYSIGYYAAAFLCVTTIQLARGSGFDLYLIYLAVAFPLMLFFGTQEFHPRSRATANRADSARAKKSLHSR